MRADHLPKDPHPNSITLEVRFQHMNLGGHRPQQRQWLPFGPGFMSVPPSLFPSFPPPSPPPSSSPTTPSGFTSFFPHWLWGSHTGCILGRCPHLLLTALGMNSEEALQTQLLPDRTVAFADSLMETSGDILSQKHPAQPLPDPVLMSETT